jgi:RHS repeat-associated protein
MRLPLLVVVDFIILVFNKIKQRLAMLFFILLILFSSSQGVVVFALPSSRQILPSAAASHHTSSQPSIGQINDSSPPAPKPLTSALPGAVDSRSPNSSDAATTSIIDQITGRGLSTPVTSTSMTTKEPVTPHELTSLRTANSSSYLNKDGSVTKTHYFSSHYYQNKGSWDTIDTSLTTDDNAADSGNMFGKALGAVEAWVSSPNTYKTKANGWETRFAPSDFSGGMVRIRMGSSQVGFAPVDANTVSPTITTDSVGRQTVHYTNLWSGVDVNYLVGSDKVSEAIVLKNKDAASQIKFKVIGANLQESSTGSKNPLSAFDITGALSDQFGIAPVDLVLNNFGPVDNHASGLSQNFSNGTYTVGLNDTYFKNLPDKAFPAVIDPDVEHFGTRAGGNYESFETNGYNCLSNVCDPYAGAVVDQNGYLQYWHSAFFVSYDQLRPGGQSLQDAVLHLTQRTGTSWWTGDTGSYNYQVGNATCMSGYNCMDGTWDSANIGTSGDIDVKNIYQNLVNNNKWDGWLALAGDDGPSHSWKAFDPDNSYITFTYNSAIPSPSFAAPQNGQTFTDTQASLRLNYENNPNSSTPLEYGMQITSGSNGTGVVINSGNYQNSPNWTVPDGVLQDGSTYYIEGSTYDPSSGLTSPWSAPVSFKIDTRIGQDKTQTYDTLGPVGVDLATGNLETGNASHVTKALGGSLGVNLDYNSPLKSRPGLIGSYWNVGSGSATQPQLQRVDQNIDFNWNAGSPGAPIANNNFDAQWNGYFVAPAAGTYYFGAVNDDNLTITVAGQQLYNNGGCYSGPCYGSSINLTAGQVVSFQAIYGQATGPNYAHIYVKGAVSEQVVPESWFQTGVRQTQQTQGLLGKYYTYTDNGNPPSFPANGTDGMFLSRTDQTINFNWNNSSPVSNGPTTDYMAQWTGYITIPANGSYAFGTNSDDGSSVTINGQTVFSKWQDSGSGNAWGSAVSLNAGTYPITVNYYQHTGGSVMSLLVEPPSLGGGSEVVPSSWLSPPQAKVLPAGWNLGTDPGGVSYTHLSVNQSNAILTDASGDTYDYVWNGTIYTPPTNSYGDLLRNNDGTFTLQDTDGRTYVFDTAGNLSQVNNPVDDQNPAGLKYSYAPINGTGPVALQQITDGVNANRYMKIYYGGASQCGTIPAGFYVAPTNMICAAQTNDNRTTYFYYSSSNASTANLTEIAKPGNDNTTYQYQSVLNPDGSTIGYQLAGIRDSLANDAVAAGIRADDETTYSQIGYDILGRAISVTEPAATAGASQIEDTVNYLVGASEEHVVNATEPAGYSKRVEYDNLYRTTRVYDNQGLATTSVWDPIKDLLYSTTNPEGLMTSTVYDDEDRPVSQYGPAPASWFSTWSWNMPNNTTWSEGQNIQSPDGRFEFVFQTDGNVVLYGPNGALWSSNTGGQTATSLAMQPDGNLVEYNGATAIWSTGTSTSGSTTSLTVQNDGNVVMSNASGPIWETNTGGWAPSPITSSYAKPLSSYASQISRSDVSYDQGLTGLGVAYMAVNEPGSNNASLVNAPLQHSTNIANDGTVSHSWGTTSPIPNYSGNWGFSMTGTMRLPTTGSWGVGIQADEGYRMWIDNQLVIDDWKDNTSGSQTTTDTQYFNNTIANSLHKVRIDYYHLTSSSQATFTLMLADPSGNKYPANMTANVAQYFSPDYGLQTSSTLYDSTYGNTTATVGYGSNPELGMATSSAVDPTGLNISASSAYETPTSGYKRLTSQTSPGGSVTSFTYYGATDTATNPCVSGSGAAYQAGLLKTETDPSPNGGTTPGKTATSVYDDAGNIVATKTNSENWECKTYDARGRLTKDVAPAYNGNPATTVTYNYNVGSNPLVTSITGAEGTITTKVDLLGRTVSYTDTYDDTTTTTYDNIGRVSSQSSQMGNQTFTYDSYSRVTDEKIGSTDLAQTTYDSFGRPSSVTYPTSSPLAVSLVYNPNTGAAATETYTMKNSAGSTITVSDAAAYSQSGKVQSNTITSGSSSLASNYTYDVADRLTSATVGSNTYTYGYGTQSSSCGLGSNMNPNSGLNGNRTSQTVNGVSTTYCYNYADQLVSSSDPSASGDVYDSHGNLTQVGTGAKPLRLYYDSSDRSNGIEQYDSTTTGMAMYYDRDAEGRIIARYENSITNGNWADTNKDVNYDYTGSGSGPSYVRNDYNWNITEEYFSLPGNVTLTIHPQKTSKANEYTYSLGDLHGNTLLSVSGTGINTSTGTGPASSYVYDPFGNPITGASDPANSDMASYGYLGDALKLTETDFSYLPIQMGARVYLSSIGRFAQMDPVFHGGVNAYTYVLDPINSSDPSGMCDVYMSLQGCAATVYDLQPTGGVSQAPTTSTTRLQSASNYTINTRPVERSVPAPAPARVAHQDVIHYAMASVSSSNITSIKNVPLKTGTLAISKTESFNYYDAGGAAMDWYGGGELAGGAVGCFLGALMTLEAAGVGCLEGAEAGSQLGGTIGSASGFSLGGYESKFSESFNWGPDQTKPWIWEK